MAMTAEPPSPPSDALPPPGWYPAPEGPFERWWDGYQWTAHARPIPASADPFSMAGALGASVYGSMSGPARAAGWLMAASGGLIVLAALMPWASFGPFTVAGTSGDGGITIVLGLVGSAGGVWRGLSQRYSGWQLGIAVAGIVVGAVVALIGFVDASDISGVATVGAGLVLTIFGGMALAGASIFAVVKQR